MEAMSLLKYWRSGGGLSRGGGGGDNGTAVTISSFTAAGEHHTAMNDSNVGDTALRTDQEEDNDDEGPFFDLEFTLPVDDDDDDDESVIENEDSDNGEEEEEEEIDSAGETDGEREFNVTVNSSGGKDSPSDDLFFKGGLVPLEPEPNYRTQFSVSLLKSATKFRVFMLGFKRQKSTPNVDKVEISNVSSSPPTHQNQEQEQGKSFTVKFKVEEVPIVSLFTRENSSRSSGNKIKNQSSEEVATEEKKFAKDVLQRYLKMIKPFYVKVSKKYSDKLRFSGQLSLALGKTEATALTATPATTSPIKVECKEKEQATPGSVIKSQKQVNLPAGLRVVCKHLGKSRSASSAVAAAPTVPAQTRRRDDSLLQQQDGIQSAILHCKRSFNSASDSDSSQLFRCISDPSLKKSLDLPGNKVKDDGEGSSSPHSVLFPSV